MNAVGHGPRIIFAIDNEIAAGRPVCSVISDFFMLWDMLSN